MITTTTNDDGFTAISTFQTGTLQFIRIMLDHEGILYSRAVGAGGEVLLVNKADHRRIEVALNEWQAAMTRAQGLFADVL